MQTKRGVDGSFAGFIALIISLVAGVVVFVPFAFDTLPLDAVTLKVPGNQGS
jgi:hypothetical protein